MWMRIPNSSHHFVGRPHWWHLSQLWDSMMVLTNSWKLKDPGQAENIVEWSGWNLELGEGEWWRPRRTEGSMLHLKGAGAAESHPRVTMVLQVPLLLNIYVYINIHTYICIYVHIHVLNNSVFFLIATINSRTCSSLKRNPTSNSSDSALLFSLSPTQLLIYFPCLWICPFWTFHMNGITQYWAFSDLSVHLVQCFQGLSML